MADPKTRVLHEIANWLPNRPQHFHASDIATMRKLAQAALDDNVDAIEAAMAMVPKPKPVMSAEERAAKKQALGNTARVTGPVPAAPPEKAALSGTATVSAAADAGTGPNAAPEGGEAA